MDGLHCCRFRDVSFYINGKVLRKLSYSTSLQSHMKCAKALLTSTLCLGNLIWYFYLTPISFLGFVSTNVDI